MPEIIRVEVSGIKCDAAGCGWSDMSVRRADFLQWLEQPCPDCGASLLTVEDMLAVLRYERAIRWVNRWFGWLAYFDKSGRETKVRGDMNGSGVIKHDWALATEEKAT